MDSLYELKQINQNTFKGRYLDFTYCQKLITHGVYFINTVLGCRVTNIFLDLNNNNIEFITEEWKTKSISQFAKDIDYWNKGREVKFFFTFLEKKITATFQKIVTTKQTFSVLNEDDVPQIPDSEKATKNSHSDWKRVSVDIEGYAFRK